MNFKPLYFLGSILVFIGLFWMLLPHAFHNEIISQLDENTHTALHYVHILEGLIPTILGLIFMIHSESKLKPKK